MSAPADTALDPAYARADEPREFVFPADHGSHPEFQTEWWYLTANLESPDGRRFGVQWTLFRRALAPHMPQRASTWATRQVYLGHFAVTDVASGRHVAFERLSRAGAGLAGADGPSEHQPLRVWLEDWSLTASSAPADFPWAFAARGHEGSDETSMHLQVEPGKDLVLQGDAGLSRKNQMPGGASYYYSFTRLRATGRLVVDGEAADVHGGAWLDREWSTSVLSPEQTGWDWFALQLDDGRELMFYRLRLVGDEGPDGGRERVDPASAGVLVSADGTVTRLRVGDVDLRVLDHWTSERSGARYPADWRLAVPDQGLDLLVRPVLADQELDVAFRYWEGAVDVSDRSGAPRGHGYVELVGYDGLD